MLGQADTLFTGADIFVSGEDIEGELRLEEISFLVGSQNSSDMLSPNELRLKMTSNPYLFTPLLI